MYSSITKQKKWHYISKGIESEGWVSNPNQCNWLGLRMPALPFKPLEVTLAVGLCLHNVRAVVVHEVAEFQDRIFKPDKSWQIIRHIQVLVEEAFCQPCGQQATYKKSEEKGEDVYIVYCCSGMCVGLQARYCNFYCLQLCFTADIPWS